MNRSTSISAPTDLVDDILAVGRHTLEALPVGDPSRQSLVLALDWLDNAIQTGQRIDTALVAVVDVIGRVAA